MQAQFKQDRLSVYLVAWSIAYREQMLTKLRQEFDKFTIVTFAGERISEDHVRVKPLPNVTGLLSRVGAKQLKKTIDRYLYFPAKTNLGIGPGKRVLSRLIQADIDRGLNVCVVQTTPPHGVTTLGRYLKQKFPHIRWIVDWQDLWTFDESYRTRVPRLYQRQLRRLERQILDMCDLNITTNPVASAILSDEFGVAPAKLTHICHAYDPDELDESSDFLRPNEPIQRHHSIRIGFLGRISKPPKVPGERVLKAFAKASSQTDIELHVFGDRSAMTRMMLSELNCRKIFLHQAVSHTEALKKIADCDLLLLALADLPNTRTIMHAKLPHYLVLNKPIIAMVPSDSFAADTIRRTKTGIVIDTSSDWARELIEVIGTYARNELIFKPDNIEIARFSWDRIAAQWVDAIKNSGIHQS